MLTLTLLRHAKSAWDDPTLDDHERPLAPRGEKAAPMIGRHLARTVTAPDLVLCSTAMRTRQTLALVLLEMSAKPAEILYEDALYLATPSQLRGRLADVATTTGHVMMVGHNPGLHALALELTGTGPKRAVVQLAKKFPTAALAVIDFPEAAAWADVHPATGTLRTFVAPRDLDG
ncbi:MAG: SixA phosphatase family protein [Hyphomicrobiaceae bacterium]